MNQIVKAVIVLTLICVVVAALLGGTYTVTEPLIAAARLESRNAAMREVLPGASDFTEIPFTEMENIESAFQDKDGTGYVFTVLDKGYGGKLSVMVGISQDGEITGSKLMNNSETPGLGAKVGKAKYADQYIGKDEGGIAQVDAVVGATISSTAYARCVNNAFKAFGRVTNPEGGADEQAQQAEADLLAMQEVLPDAAAFEELDISAMEGITAAAKDSGGNGYAFKAQAQGFAGPINVMVGIDASGNITAVKLMENDETENYGAKAGEPEYTGQYKGKDAGTFQTVDAVAGATKTSNAFQECVKAAFAAFESLEVS